MNLIKLEWRGRLFAYAPLILWIGLIFFFSSGAGSMSETSRIIRPILEFLFPTASEETLQIYHGYIRKSAHFGEYAVLAFLALRTFGNSASGLLRKFSYPASFALVVLVSVVDEVNQSFLASRTGSPVDVAIDLAGGLAMLIALWMIKTRRLERKRPRLQ